MQQLLEFLIVVNSCLWLVQEITTEYKAVTLYLSTLPSFPKLYLLKPNSAGVSDFLNGEEKFALFVTSTTEAFCVIPLGHYSSVSCLNNVCPTYIEIYRKLQEFVFCNIVSSDARDLYDHNTLSIYIIYAVHTCIILLGAGLLNSYRLKVFSSWDQYCFTQKQTKHPPQKKKKTTTLWETKKKWHFWKTLLENCAISAFTVIRDNWRTKYGFH